MPTRSMNLPCGLNRLALPSSQGVRARRLWPCAVIAAVMAVYVLGYFSVRRVHRLSNGRLGIDTGSRIANRIFAPAISLEMIVRDRPRPDPETMFKSFLGESRSSRRPILIVLGTKKCLPCRQLERFLEDQRAIVSKYFVVMKADVDDETTPGILVRDRYRTPSESEGYTHYFPWIAFINGNGELLVTGDDGPNGLIGIPQGGPQDRAWFLRMLRIVNPAITDDEIASLDTAAAAYHKLIWRDVARSDGH